MQPETNATTIFQLLQAALSASADADYKPMAIAFVDTAGQLVAAIREPGASSLRLDIAHGKAAAAAGMGVNTRILSAKAAKMPGFFNAIGQSSCEKFIPQTGGIVLINSEQQVIGALGASGGTGDEDEQILVSAAESLGISWA